MTSATFLINAIVWVSVAMTGVLLLSAVIPARKAITITARRQRQR